MTKTTWQVQQYLETTATANGKDVDEVKRELVREWFWEEGEPVKEEKN